MTLLQYENDLYLHVLKTCFVVNASREYSREYNRKYSGEYSREYATNSNCINNIFVAKRTIE